MDNQSNQLFHLIIRLNKSDSAFFYFQLEANDGISFYSTLESNPHDQFRDIDLKGDIKLVEQIRHIIERCRLKFPIEILTDEVIQDKV